MISDLNKALEELDKNYEALEPVIDKTGSRNNNAAQLNDYIDEFRIKIRGLQNEITQRHNA